MTRLPSPLALASGVALVLVAATGCVSTQDIEAIQSQLADIQRQVLQMQMQAPSKGEVESLTSEISSQRDSLLQSEADMQLRLRDLSNQIEQLESKLEDTNFRLANLSQQIAATNEELKAFRNLPRFTEPVVDPAAISSPTAISDPQSLYDNAYGDYVRGSYDLAIRQFQEYLRNFPSTDLSDNAAYWIGECFYRQNRFRQAIAEFDRVLDRYPGSDKVASALLKKGYAYLELGEQAQAVNQLRFVVREYAGSDEARLARQRLAEIGVDAR